MIGSVLYPHSGPVAPLRSHRSTLFRFVGSTLTTNKALEGFLGF